MIGWAKMRDRPDARTLRRLAVPGPEGDPRTIETACAIAAREEAAGEAPVVAWADRLAALYGGPAAAHPPPSGTARERRPAQELRARRFDPRPRRPAASAQLIARPRAQH